MQVTFTVDVKAPVATKGLAGIDVNSLMVLAYTTGGDFISELPILKTTEKDSKVQFLCNFNAALPVTGGPENAPSYKFVVLTNSTDEQYGMSYDSNKVPQIETLDFSYPFKDTVPMWGVKTFTLQYGTDGKVLETQELGQIDVLRSAAKVGVRLSDELKAEGYTIKDIKINYVSGSGYSVPANWNTVAVTDALSAADGFRPAPGVSLTDVNAFSISNQAGYEGMHYMYIPEIENDEELAMAITFLKDGEEIPFTYENGIKFRTYLEGKPTEDKFNVVRNHFYDYKVTAIHTSIALELIEYETLPWIPEDVEIGGEVKYLVLNTDLVKIYSENVDATTLKFTSSSPIASVVLKDMYSHDVQGERFEKGSDAVSAYYVGKFGQKTQLGTDPGFTMPDKEAALAKEQVILANISADAEQNVLQGGITITSPFMADPENETAELQGDSHYDTVRYLEFEVTNQQGLTEVFRVEQYPPVVITNEQGYLSYRDDFTRKTGEEPAYWGNFKGPGSISVLALSLYHEHDWTEEASLDQLWWDTRQSDRDYRWLNPGTENPYTWTDNNNSCPQVLGHEKWEEIRYLFVMNDETFISHEPSTNGKEITKRFSGGYRPYGPNGEAEGYATEAFVRGRYWNLPGAASPKMESQGVAIGPYYERTVMIDGVPTKRTFRKHYTWNVQPVFYSKYVSKVYPADGKNPSNRVRLKGQADIHTLMDGSVPDDIQTDFNIYNTPRLYRNHRMYHIRATSSSDKYTLGRPQLVDRNGNPTEDAEIGMTANTQRNAGLVSPYLALASQLGETDYNYIVENARKAGYRLPVLSDFYKLAENHCREYVEASYEDLNGNGQYDPATETLTHYHDWRLPTKAEIEMIIDFQTNSRAMDKVLIGEHFVCVTGNPGEGDNEEYWVSSEVPGYKVSAADDLDGIAYNNYGYYIRCVRDVYED